MRGNRFPTGVANRWFAKTNPDGGDAKGSLCILLTATCQRTSRKREGVNSPPLTKAALVGVSMATGGRSAMWSILALVVVQLLHVSDDLYPWCCRTWADNRRWFGSAHRVHRRRDRTLLQGWFADMASIGIHHAFFCRCSGTLYTSFYWLHWIEAKAGGHRGLGGGSWSRCRYVRERERTSSVETCARIRRGEWSLHTLPASRARRLEWHKP